MLKDPAVRLTFHARLAEVARLSKMWDQLAEEHALPDEPRLAIQLAVEEAVTNIILHGYQQHPDKTFSVEIHLPAGRIEVVVVDSALPFNPLVAPPPRLDESLQDRVPGGLGIHLVRKLMDHVSYERIDGENRLTMCKLYPRK